MKTINSKQPSIWVYRSSGILLVVYGTMFFVPDDGPLLLPLLKGTAICAFGLEAIRGRLVSIFPLFLIGVGFIVGGIILSFIHQSVISLICYWQYRLAIVVFGLFFCCGALQGLRFRRQLKWL